MWGQTILETCVFLIMQIGLTEGIIGLEVCKLDEWLCLVKNRVPSAPKVLTRRCYSALLNNNNEELVVLGEKLDIRDLTSASMKPTLKLFSEKLTTGDINAGALNQTSPRLVAMLCIASIFHVCAIPHNMLHTLPTLCTVKTCLHSQNELLIAPALKVIAAYGAEPDLDITMKRNLGKTLAESGVARCIYNQDLVTSWALASQTLIGQDAKIDTMLAHSGFRMLPLVKSRMRPRLTKFLIRVPYLTQMLGSENMAQVSRFIRRTVKARGWSLYFCALTFKLGDRKAVCELLESVANNNSVSVMFWRELPILKLGRDVAEYVDVFSDLTNLACFGFIFLWEMQRKVSNTKHASSFALLESVHFEYLVTHPSSKLARLILRSSQSLCKPAGCIEFAKLARLALQHNLNSEEEISLLEFILKETSPRLKADAFLPSFIDYLEGVLMAHAETSPNIVMAAIRLVKASAKLVVQKWFPKHEILSALLSIALREWADDTHSSRVMTSQEATYALVLMVNSERAFALAVRSHEGFAKILSTQVDNIYFEYILSGTIGPALLAQILMLPEYRKRLLTCQLDLNLHDYLETYMHLVRLIVQGHTKFESVKLICMFLNLMLHSFFGRSALPALSSYVSELAETQNTFSHEFKCVKEMSADIQDVAKLTIDCMSYFQLEIQCACGKAKRAVLHEFVAKNIDSQKELWNPTTPTSTWAPLSKPLSQIIEASCCISEDVLLRIGRRRRS